MNTKLLHRLVWKEVRTLRPLWLSVLGIGIALQLFYMLLFDDREYGVLLSQAWFGTAIVLPIVLGLVSIAIAFAGEREEGTDQMLCRLGVAPVSLFLVKTSINLAGAVSLFLVMFPLAMLFSGAFLQNQEFFDSIIGCLRVLAN